MRGLSHLILCRNGVEIYENIYPVKEKIISDALEFGQ